MFLKIRKELLMLLLVCRCFITVTYTFNLIIEFLNFEITPYGFWMTLFKISITNNLTRIFISLIVFFSKGTAQMEISDLHSYPQLSKILIHQVLIVLRRIWLILHGICYYVTV